MKTNKIFLLLLLLSLFANITSAITIDETVYMYADSFTLQTYLEQTYSFIGSDGHTYWNLTEGGNITFVSNASSSKNLIERDGHFGYGDYRTTLTFDIYATSTWTIDNFYMRVYAGDNSFVKNYTTGFTITTLNSSHKRYSILFQPNTLTVPLNKTQEGAFDINIYARAHNTTLHYYGNRTFNSLFNVYILDHPYNISSPYNATWQSINMTWGATTAINHSDRTIILRRNDTYPNSPFDTNAYTVYNGTDTWHNETSVTTTRYYRIFNWNQTTHSWASTYISWGALEIWNVYNESNMSQSIWYNIQISDYNGSITYVDYDVHEVLLIDFAAIPLGNNTIFVLWNDTNAFYKQRIYYKDLLANHFYNFTFYLPPLFEAGSGGGTGDNDTYSYIITVVGQQFEYGTSPPIQGALVTIMRYNNVTDEYVEVASLLSGANGECTPVYLISGVLYKLIVTKDGYNTSITDYIPDPTASRTIILRIIPITPTVPELPKFTEHIIFTAVMLSNNTILVNYTDNNLTTIDTHIYIYEMYNRNQTLMATSIEDHNYDFQFYTTVNTSRTYLITLFFNNTIEYDISSPYSITVYPITGLNRTKFDLEARISGVFGPLSIGWANVISVALAIILLVSIGPFNTGVGIISSGIGILGTQSLFGIYFTNSFNPWLAALGPFIIAIGIIYMWTKGNGENL